MVMGEEVVGAVGGAGGEAIVVALSVGEGSEGALDSFDISSNDTSDSYLEARLFCLGVVFCSIISNLRGDEESIQDICDEVSPSKKLFCPYENHNLKQTRTNK